MAYCGNALYELERARVSLRGRSPDDLLDAARRVLRAYYYLRGIDPGYALVSLAESALADERLSDLVKAVGLLSLARAYGARRSLVDSARKIVESRCMEVQREYEERCK
ncbi:MAG: hypothetical protein OWQ51_06575 [Pyrobaculum arsenaticum]|uniref:HEPN domain-containing protein n=1 Tax=Pyrobaculum arsenaticum (strain DSM 13514 / JCM 11321 / PZ6) TaxID=340102 RepID=A4WJZ6_PYRAR|nr:hypothetical protein [Pyrobaculum arsenaticum]ABP50713.1 hypothetical protein Pars_1135 [Pyrobaculum arsenaticum DSM 13514]MCY0890627.1 hypothetical protein [Pyrobaculum arsenaticum]